MAIGSKLGGAYVEIGADVGGFGSKVIAAVRKDMAEAQRVARAQGRAVGRELADGILQGFRRSWPGVASEIRAQIRLFEATVRVRVDVDSAALRRAVAGANVGVPGGGGGSSVFRTIAAAASAASQATQSLTGALDTAGNAMARSADAAGRAGSAVNALGDQATSAVNGIASGLSGGGGGAGVAGGVAGGVSDAAGKVVQSFVAVQAAVAKVVAVSIIAIASIQAIGRELLTLSKLGLVAPALLAVTAGIIAPIYAAIKGIGPGITAALDKTLTDAKFKKTIKKFSDSLQAVLWDVRNARPFFSKLAMGAQSALFKHLGGIIPTIVKDWGPAFQAGFEKVASAAGTVIRWVFNRFNQPETAAAIERLFDSSARFVKNVGEGFANLLASLGRLSDDTLPFVDRFGESINSALTKIADWIDEKREEGTITKWIEEGIETFQEFRELAQSTLKLLGALFDEDRQSGDSFLETIQKIIDKIREFVESERGRETLHGIRMAAELCGVAFLTVVAIIGSIIVAIGELMYWAKQAYNALVGWARGADILANSLYRVLSVGNQVSHMKTVVKQVGSGMGSFADGGIITRHQIAEIGEGNLPEVVLPLTKPARARQLAAQTNLRSILGDGGGSDTVVVYIGNEQVDAHISRVTSGTIGGMVRGAQRRGFPTTSAA